MFERFTDRGRRVLVLAQEEARRLDHAFIGTEHILLGLMAEDRGVAAKALQSFDISLAQVRERVVQSIGTDVNPPGDTLPFTPRAKKVLELSLREALQLGHSYIGTEHLLLGLVREGQGMGITVLSGLGVEPGRVRQKVLALMSENAPAAPSGEVREEEVALSLLVDAPVPPPSPPRCPHCRVSLTDVAVYRTITARPDVDGADQRPIMFDVVYCGQCGMSLHMFRKDERSPS
jgi:ATP-dependent Clp protease ATP-binding subunit ClpC